MTHDLRRRLPSITLGVASLGLVHVLSAGCVAVVGDPQASATDGATNGATDGTDTSGQQPETGGTTDAGMGTTAGMTTSTEGGPASTGATTGPEPTTSTDGSTGSAESDTGSGTGSASYPVCLEPLLAPYHDSLGPACEGFVIIEYTFQGEQMFVFDSSQCGFFDQFFPVFDEGCELRCNLYGLAGNTQCEGVEFYDNATEIDSWPYPE